MTQALPDMGLFVKLGTRGRYNYIDSITNIIQPKDV